MDEHIVVLEGTLTVSPDHTAAIPPGAEHAFHVTGEDTAHLPVFFPGLESYSAGHTHCIEGAETESVSE